MEPAPPECLQPGRGELSLLLGYLRSRLAAWVTPGTFQPQICATPAPPAGSARLAPNSLGRSDGAHRAPVGPR